MSFQLVPKSVTLNDLERRDGPYFVLFHRFCVRYRLLMSFWSVIPGKDVTIGLYNLGYCQTKPTSSKLFHKQTSIQSFFPVC